MAVLRGLTQRSWGGVSPGTRPPPARRFAYVLHRADATLVNPPQAAAPHRQALEDGSSEPLLLLPDVEVTPRDGRTTHGDVILAGHPMPTPGDTADLASVLGAVRLAVERQAQVVGFSAAVAAQLGGGRSIGGACCVTGQAMTAAAVHESFARALHRLGRQPGNATAAVSGAAGKLGTALAARLAESVEQLLLVADLAAGEVAGRPALVAAAGEVCRHLAENDDGCAAGPFAERVRELASEGSPYYRDDYRRLAERLVAEGLLTLTADRRRLLLADLVVIAEGWGPIDPGLLPPAALVCDLRRPRALSRREALARPDLMVIDPVSFELRDGTGPAGLFGTRGLPASLVEALVCALDPTAAAIARNAYGAPWGASERLLRRAGALGFEPAPLCSFQTRVEEPRWDAMAKLRVLPRRVGLGASRAS